MVSASTVFVHRSAPEDIVRCFDRTTQSRPTAHAEAAVSAAAGRARIHIQRVGLGDDDVDIDERRAAHCFC
jgi:hypothetical protein